MDSLQKLAEEFWNKFFTRLIRGSVAERLSEAKKDKATILILSASPEFLVKPLAAMLDVSLAKGTEYEIDEKNCLKKVRCFVHGEKKVDYLQDLQKKLEVQAISVYSDCISDLSLLKLAKVPICVRPKRKLAALCKKYNWETIDG